jgi:type 1 glutamine amidotransferase
MTLSRREFVGSVTGSNPGQTEPIAWTRDYKGSRVFYTSLGNGETFEDKNFRRLLANALFWTTRREVAKR